MKPKNTRLLKITTTAAMIALTCVLTMVVRIPTPTKGYLNLGDVAVLLSGWLLGPLYGAIAGGVGSALADLLSGYPVYIPATFIIKATMAFLVSLVPLRAAKREKSRPRLGFMIFAPAAELVMAAGYYLYEAVVVGEGFAAAFAGVPGNAAQGLVGAAGAYLLIELLGRTEFFKIYGIYGFGGKRNENDLRTGENCGRGTP